MESDSEESLKRELEELQKLLGKKLRFEEAVRSLHSLLRELCPSASHSLRKLFYSVVCRVATILKTRYTAPGFWLAGLRLFEQAECTFSDPSEKEHLKKCIAQAKDHLHNIDNPQTDSQSSENRGYLFEGHLTVDPEPPMPQWLVQQNLLAAVASLSTAESSRGPMEDSTVSETAGNLIQSLIDNLDSVIPEILETDGAIPRAPPASKEVVAKLPIIHLTEEVLVKLGEDAECAICKENLVVGDKMQELPCNHKFHPPCLKPWLDEHNSCPICRYELQTDDHNYESWKVREKEAEEERKGAANAIRGAMNLFEVVHFVPEKPMYEQGLAMELNRGLSANVKSSRSPKDDYTGSTWLCLLLRSTTQNLSSATLTHLNQNIFLASHPQQYSP